MSLVFGSREVVSGPMVGFQGDGSGFMAKNQQKSQQKDDVMRGLSCVSVYVQSEGKGKSHFCRKENRGSNGGEVNRCDGVAERVRVSDQGEGIGGGFKGLNRFCLEQRRTDYDASESSENSSIDVAESSCTSSDDFDDGSSDAEVQSKIKSPLSSMDSLEESLPIKRGLSNFFAGKSKSFTSLSEATTVKDLAKPENQFNKRRRTLLACKRGFSTPQSSSFCNLTAPDFALPENEEEEGENDDICPSTLPLQGRRKIKSFISSRSFSLTDLQGG